VVVVVMVVMVEFMAAGNVAALLAHVILDVLA